MELVVRKNDLLRELQLFQGIVERKNTIPILANVLLEAKGDEVKLLATDLEVALRSRCKATVSKPGSLTLPAKKLYEIVKSLPETDIRITEEKNGVSVSTALARGQRFPRLALQMISGGEESGALDALLVKTAETFEQETALSLDRMLAALVPIVTVVLAVVIGVVVMSVLLPLYDLTNAIG